MFLQEIQNLKFRTKTRNNDKQRIKNVGRQQLRAR